MNPSLTILGSAAAEGIPAMFCGCRVCSEAWRLGGKDIRMRAAYKLNDRVRVDFGPDTLAQEYRFRLHSENLRHLFITHPHEDHLYNDLFIYRMPGFSVVPDESLLTIYGTKGTIRDFMSFMWNKKGFFGDLEHFRMKTVMLDYFEPVVPEGEDMEFIPMPANHMMDSPWAMPSIYAVRSGAKRILIANDTGVFPDPTWKFLEEKRFPFDIVINDCTGGILDYRDGHMSGKYVLETKKRLEDIGCVSKTTKYVINHFSHNGKATHEELQEYFNPHGIFVGYDGMEL